ncbi:MAG TPA: class I SAM-dependent methyltransferase [Chitinophagaceae bacterium]
MDATRPLNEQMAAEAFNRQSAVFDSLYSGDTIIQYKRARVRDHVNVFLKPKSFILELNAGTGEDAAYFARNGHNVHATDIAAGMQLQLKEKVINAGLQEHVTTEVCSFTDLNNLRQRGPYDLVFSNFAGLNCTGELETVLTQLPALVKPGGLITLVILPKFCLWETMLMLKGKFKTATRRFFNKDGAQSHVEGTYFKCYYYDPGFIIRRLKKSFQPVSLEGLCTIVPPSYMHGFAEKHPKLFQLLVKQENRLKNKWPWKYIGDYYILTMKKNNPSTDASAIG